MFHRTVATMLLLTLSTAGISGCQPLARVHYQAGIAGAEAAGTRTPSSASRIILAADFADPPASSTQPSEEPAKSDDEKKKDDTGKPAPGYTAPSEAIRQLILMTAVATTSGPATGNTAAGKELAEAGAALTGSPGLSAPIVSAQATGVIGPPGVGASGLSGPTGSVQATGVIGPPGLQEGAASALGPIAANNLFQSARNTLSGLNGGCAALARGGFFQGQQAGCRSFFHLEPRARLNHGTSKFARK